MVRLEIVGVAFDARAFPSVPGVEFPMWHPLDRLQVAKRIIAVQGSDLSIGLTNLVLLASLGFSKHSTYTAAQQPV